MRGRDLREHSASPFVYIDTDSVTTDRTANLEKVPIPLVTGVSCLASLELKDGIAVTALARVFPLLWRNSLFDYLHCCCSVVVSSVVVKCGVIPAGTVISVSAGSDIVSLPLSSRPVTTSQTT